MAGMDVLKNRLIDRILATRNQKLLEAIEMIFSSSQSDEDEILKLTSEQIEMLIMSEQDITCNNLISESALDKLDIEWLG